jgi:F0F1-type ATP synthase membrane subunit b/b'
VGQILEQLELNRTFLIEFAIFGGLFLILANLFFKPFMRLFEIRHKRTIEDREAAEKMMAEADARFEEYRKRLHDERVRAKQDFEKIIADARRDESEILGHAREEAKKITQEANDSIAKQRESLKKQIEADIESLAAGISERLLSRKV